MCRVAGLQMREATEDLQVAIWNFAATSFRDSSAHVLSFIHFQQLHQRQVIDGADNGFLFASEIALDVDIIHHNIGCFLPGGCAASCSAMPRRSTAIRRFGDCSR